MKHERIKCIDAMRGFDMFWIIGGREMLVGTSVLVLGRVPGPLAYHITHPVWSGFSAWDLIMPVFLFLVGTVLPLSLLRERDSGTSMIQIHFRIARRVLVLWILGLIMEGSVALAAFSGDIHDVRAYSSTLHAIAVGYLLSALAVLHINRWGQAVILGGCLLLYWVVLMFIPFAGNPGGTFQADRNLAQFLDNWILGGFDDGTPYTWILSSLGFTASVLLGVFAGHLINSERDATSKLRLLLSIGVAMLILALAWHQILPINRRLWTSSMVLWAGGWNYLTLAIFYYVVDVRRWRRWVFPFTVIGSNAILAYMLGEQWVQTWVRLIVPFSDDTLMEAAASVLAFASLYALFHLMYSRHLFVRV